MSEQLDLIDYIMFLEEKQLVTLYRMDEVTASGVIFRWPEWVNEMFNEQTT